MKNLLKKENNVRAKEAIDSLLAGEHLSRAEWTALIQAQDAETSAYLFEKAVAVRETYYKKDVYTRGLIEISSYCKNNCLYCGIRAGNTCAQRYRLTKEEILSCCEAGYALGFRTFVLQGGEDPQLTPEWIAQVVRTIHKTWPDCAITLSLGEFPKEVYQEWFDSGAERYLLRHETANRQHYERLHPAAMSFDNRRRCLYDLKEIGYQVGCGFMVGSPGQSAACLADDMLFLEELQPDMVGIGPFISHKDTPFAQEPSGTLEQTLYMLGLIRLLLPKVLLPATTALGTIHPLGREKGILAGANVCMPNLSPLQVRKKYMLYDNKICTGDESAQCVNCLDRRMQTIGYTVVSSRGDPWGRER